MKAVGLQPGGTLTDYYYPVNNNEQQIYDPKRKCHKNEDFFSQDDHGLLIKIELAVFTSGAFFIAGTLALDYTGIPSASIMIAFIAVLKLIYFTYLIHLFATEEHYNRYSSHNWFIKTDKFFRLLTLFCLIAVGVFDVTTHETVHYVFVAMGVFFLGLSLLAAQGAIMRKEYEANEIKKQLQYSQLKKQDNHA